MPSKKLPLRETAVVVSKKLPLRETVWLLNGFILQENVIQWHQDQIVLIENIKSFMTTQLEMVDKNHIKIKWFGDSVPKVQVWKRGIDEDYGTKPYAEVNWSPQEYLMPIDINSYVLKVAGINNTGSSQELQLGVGQDYPVDMNLQLPINEKHYYFDIAVTTVYRIEVNL